MGQLNAFQPRVWVEKNQYCLSCFCHYTSTTPLLSFCCYAPPGNAFTCTRIILNSTDTVILLPFYNHSLASLYWRSRCHHQNFFFEFNIFFLTEFCVVYILAGISSRQNGMRIMTFKNGKICLVYSSIFLSVSKCSRMHRTGGERIVVYYIQFFAELIELFPTFCLYFFFS